MVNILNKKENIKILSEFYFQPDLFDFTLTAGEKEIINDLLEKSVTDPNTSVLYSEIDGKIAGAIGIIETKVKNGGFEIIYWTVTKEFRGQGIGNTLFEAAEDHIRKLNGRFIVIETGDSHHSEKSREIYEKKGYKQVGHIPFYYHKDEGMFIYQKLM